MVISHFTEFVTSVSCIPYTQKVPKTQNNLWHGSCGMPRSIDLSEDVFVEYPVCVISVAVLAAVV